MTVPASPEGPDEGLREQVQALRDGIYEGTIPGSNLREIALALDAALSAPRPSGLSEDDERDVQTALRCVDADNAGHWPTVAGVLAAEVRRLRPLLTAERERADNARLRAVPAGRRRPVVEGDYR